MKKIAIYLLIICGFLWMPVYALSVDNPVDPPTMEESEPTDDAGIDRYTLEEFDALSDDAKQDVYLNFPEQLPDNFSTEAYVDIFYPAQESGE